MLAGPSERISGALSRHAFFLVFSASLFAATLLLGAVPSVFAALFFVTILPGYFLLLLIAEQGEVERAVMAFPAGVMLTGAVTMVPNLLFGLKSVHWSAVAVAELGLASFLLMGKKEKITLPEIFSVRLAALALGVAGLAFGAHLISYGNFNQAEPVVQSIDGVTQVVQTAWVARRGDYSLAPAFNPRGSELFAGHFPSVSIVSQAVAIQLAGTLSWNVNPVFQALLFATMSMGLFLFFSRLAGFHAGLVAGAAPLLPPTLDYVSPFFLGLWRTTFTMALVPLVLYACVKCVEEKGKWAGVLAVLVLLLASVHPVDAVAVAVPLALVALASLRDGFFWRLAKPFLAASVLFFILILPHAVHYYPSNDSSPFSALPLFSLSFNAEEVFGWAVSTKLVKLSDTTLWVAAACLAALAFMAFRPSFSNKPIERTYFVAGLVSILATTSGIFPFLSLYILTQRYVLFADFLLPLAAVGIFLVFALALEKAAAMAATEPRGLFAAASALTLISLLVAPWAYAFPVKQNNPLPGPAWDVLSFIGRNSSADSKVLFINYFTQYSGCMAARRCSEVSFDDFISRAKAKNYSRYIPVSPVCKEAVRKIGFLSFEPAKCEPGFDYTDICSYEYVVMAHYHPYADYTVELSERLEPAFQTVYSRDFFIVKRRISAVNTSCIE